MGAVHDAQVAYIRHKAKLHDRAYNERHPEGQTKLSVSALGRCVREAYQPLFGVEKTHEFDEYVESIIDSGNVWEEETAKALKFEYGDLVIVDQAQLGVENEIWSGRKDFLFVAGGPYPDGAIIEHKNTDKSNFYRRIPYAHHVYQLLMYKRLLDQPDIETWLYYRERARWAELKIWEEFDGVHWQGEIQGASYNPDAEGLLDAFLDVEIAKFEEWWGRGELPPRQESPFANNYVCLKKDKHDRWWPACLYCGACWPSLNGEGPFYETEWTED